MKLRQIVLCLGLLIMLPGCQAAAEPPNETYTNPFAYCAAVGTIDVPGTAYTGAAVPPAVVEGLSQALNAPDTPLSALESGASWRCMNGKVYACFVGANLPCAAKANTERTPVQEAVDFCRDNPGSDFIPAAVTGRETLFEWRCRDGVPEIGQQLFEPDAQGFRSDIWYSLTSPEAASGIANPASQFCEEQGYQWEVRDEAGGQVGYCLFSDGSECEEWAFYHGMCVP